MTVILWQFLIAISTLVVWRILGFRWGLVITFVWTLWTLFAVNNPFLVFLQLALLWTVVIANFVSQHKSKILTTSQTQIHTPKLDLDFISPDEEKSFEAKNYAIVTAHKQFLENLGISWGGTIFSKHHKIRSTHCYNCKTALTTHIDIECVSCGWLLCTCGACGCGWYGYR
jgi:hypothetical protein